MVKPLTTTTTTTTEQRPPLHTRFPTDLTLPTPTIPRPFSGFQQFLPFCAGAAVALAADCVYAQLRLPAEVEEVEVIDGDEGSGEAGGGRRAIGV